MRYLKSIKYRGRILYQNYRRNVLSYLNDKRTCTTKRKIIVFDSDDWGSIRMPDKSVFKACLRAGIPIDKDLFAHYDTLASEEDFEALYEVLQRHEDTFGRHPSLTINVVMGNPDFDKIRESQFEKYYFELFTETMKRYPNRNLAIWKQGINEDLLCPELHGREHVNVLGWLNNLKEGIKPLRFAFSHGFFALSRRACPDLPQNYLSALNYTDEEGKAFAFQSVQEAAGIFHDIFGCPPESFIAPNYCWDENIERALLEEQIKYIKGKEYQKHPEFGRKYHFSGERNSHQQVYLVRNINFEPCTSHSIDWVGETLSAIKRAFDNHHPAVICTHRLNFVGSLKEENRSRTLAILDEVLREIIKRWPDVEFLRTSDLMKELQP